MSDSASSKIVGVVLMLIIAIIIMSVSYVIFFTNFLSGEETSTSKVRIDGSQDNLQISPVNLDGQLKVLVNGKQVGTIQEKDDLVTLTGEVGKTYNVQVVSGNGSKAEVIEEYTYEPGDYVEGTAFAITNLQLDNQDKARHVSYEFTIKNVGKKSEAPDYEVNVLGDSSSSSGTGPSLDEGETTTVSGVFTDVQPGEREVVVSVTNSPDYSNNQVGKTVNVLEPTRFVIQDYNIREQGDRLVYDVTVENTGVSGTRVVGARLEGENTPPTEVWFVFDLSSSMISEKNGAISSANAFASKVKSQVPNTMFGIATATFDRQSAISNCRQRDSDSCAGLSDSELMDGFVAHYPDGSPEALREAFSNLRIKCSGCRTFEPYWDSINDNVLPNRDDNSNLIILAMSDEYQGSLSSSTKQALEEADAHVVCVCTSKSSGGSWNRWSNDNPDKSDYISLPSNGEFEETLVGEIGNTVIRSAYNTKELTLDRGETDTISIELDTSGFEPGTYETSIVTSDDSRSTTTSID